MYTTAATIETGALSLCESDISEFITWGAVGSAPELHLNPSLHRTPTQTLITSLEQDKSMKLFINGAEPGTFSVSELSTLSGFNNFSVTIDEYGAVDEYITGIMSGVDGSGRTYKGRFKVNNDSPDPVQTNCSIPESAFRGNYRLEATQGNDQCFGGTILDTTLNVNIEYVSEFERKAWLRYLPNFADTDIEFHFILSCDQVFVPYVNSGLACDTTEVVLNGGLPLGSFNSGDDSALSFNLTDIVFPVCDCDKNPDNLYRLVKQ